MVNDRGYTDAFQLRCIDVAARSESSRQFEVAASTITIAHVSNLSLLSVHSGAPAQAGVSVSAGSANRQGWASFSCPPPGRA